MPDPKSENLSPSQKAARPPFILTSSEHVQLSHDEQKAFAVRNGTVTNDPPPPEQKEAGK